MLNVTYFTAALPADAYWATVLVQYQGRSGDLVPIATSFDVTGSYGLQTPFSEGVSPLWKGSMWHADVLHNSLITVGNAGSDPTHAAITLFYNNGSSSYTVVKPLAPGDQAWVNVGQIISAQIPDKDGKTIPGNVMMGSYELRDLDHVGVGFLYEGKLVIDKTWGHGYYGCGVCCGITSTKLTPNPNSGAVGTGAGNVFDALNACTNNWTDVTAGASQWSSTNSAIVNVANAYSNFMSVGTITGSAYEVLSQEQVRLMCPNLPFTPQNVQTATPWISYGGKNVTGETTNVVVGQQIAVTANGIPSGSISTQSWSIGGPSYVGGYQVAPGFSSGGPITASTSGSTATYYYTAAGTSTVTYTATLTNNSIVSAATTFIVSAPTFTITSQVGTININSDDGLELQLGRDSAAKGAPGVKFVASITQPPGVTGSSQWVQLVESYSGTYSPGGGTCTSSGLDTDYPYSTGPTVTDSPAVALQSPFTSEQISTSFVMYLQWQPPAPSIPVAIGQAIWSWSAAAALSGSNWAISGTPSPPTPTVGAAAVATPQWSQIANGSNNCH